MKSGVFWATVYVICGVYFVNKGILFYELPEIIGEFDRWLTLAGGILILLGGINHFRVHTRKTKSQ